MKIINTFNSLIIKIVVRIVVSLVYVVKENLIIVSNVKIKSIWWNKSVGKIVQQAIFKCRRKDSKFVRNVIKLASLVMEINIIIAFHVRIIIIYQINSVRNAIQAV